MTTTSEKAIQKSATRPRRSVHHASFLWALYQEPVRSTTHRFGAPSAAGSPSRKGDLGDEPALSQPLAGGTGVVAAIQVDAGTLGQPSQRRRLEGLVQERRVVAVGRGGDGAQGIRITGHCAACVMRA